MPQTAASLPTADSTPIGRRPLHEETAERLREMIVSGELGPGERVSEKALCLRFGVSRTPLRESLKVLAAEGLIDLLPHRGARVAALAVSNALGDLVDPADGRLVAGTGIGSDPEAAAARFAPACYAKAPSGQRSFGRWWHAVGRDVSPLRS